MIAKRPPLLQISPTIQNFIFCQTDTAHPIKTNATNSSKELF